MPRKSMGFECSVSYTASTVQVFLQFSGCPSAPLHIGKRAILSQRLPSGSSGCSGHCCCTLSGALPWRILSLGDGSRRLQLSQARQRRQWARARSAPAARQCPACPRRVPGLPVPVVVASLGPGRRLLPVKLGPVLCPETLGPGLPCPALLPCLGVLSLPCPRCPVSSRGALPSMLSPVPCPCPRFTPGGFGGGRGCVAMVNRLAFEILGYLFGFDVPRRTTQWL